MAPSKQALDLAASLLAPIEDGRLSLPCDEVAFVGVEVDGRLHRQVVRALAVAVQAGLDARPEPPPAPPAPEPPPASPAAPEPILTRQQRAEVAGLLTRYADSINRRCGEAQDARRYAELLREGT